MALVIGSFAVAYLLIFILASRKSWAFTYTEDDQTLRWLTFLGYRSAPLSGLTAELADRSGLIILRWPPSKKGYLTSVIARERQAELVQRLNALARP